jgi:hypothetical protein
MHYAYNISQFKVVDNDLADFKRKFVIVSDFLMDNKADVNTEWFAGVGHGVILWSPGACS